jgi:hypothetical protein
MLLLPVTNKVFHEPFIGWILHQSRVDTHFLNLIEEVDPGLVNTLADEAFVRIIAHMCDVYKGALRRCRDTGLVNFRFTPATCGTLRF